MAHTGDIFINEDKEYIYLSDDDNNYYLIKDGNYHLVATYALASSISGFDPAGVANELVTKNMVAETGCKFKETTILPYNELPDTVCVLYEDLEADADIALPGGEGQTEGDYYGDNFYKFFYRTTNNEEITPRGGNDWYYSTGSEGNTFYYDVKTNMGAIAIPDNAFSGRTTLKSVVTNCNIRNIGYGCFSGCTNLTDVQIYGDGGLTIGNSSFRDCTSLKSVVFGSYWYNSMDDVGVSNWAFYGCEKLQHLQGQDNIRYVASYAFHGCKKLDALTLINCTDYGAYAFSGCTGLTKIMMKGNAEAQSANTVFSGCTNVKEVIFVGSQVNDVIPRMLVTLSQYNSNLIVRVPLSDLPTYKSYFNNTIPGGASRYSWYQNLESNSYSNESEIKFASTSDTLLYDNYNAANGLIEAAIAQGWLKYNTRTFTLYDAQKVTNRNMNRDNQVNGVEILSRDDGSMDRDFDYSMCNKEYHGLKNFNAFQYFTNVTEIPSSCFKDSTQLTSIKLPNTITKIGDYAFSGCTSLVGSITLGDNVTTIGDYVFKECNYLTAITIGTGVTSMGNGIIEGCSDGGGVNVTYSAINCADLESSLSGGDSDVVKSITFTDGVQHIPAKLCDDCDLLTEVIIPNSVKTIGDNAFDEADNITSVTIGTGITSIGKGAFNETHGIVTIKATTPPTIGANVFDSDNIQTIKVPSSSVDTYKSAPGWSAYRDLIIADE